MVIDIELRASGLYCPTLDIESTVAEIWVDKDGNWDDKHNGYLVRHLWNLTDDY